MNGSDPLDGLFESRPAVPWYLRPWLALRTWRTWNWFVIAVSTVAVLLLAGVLTAGILTAYLAIRPGPCILTYRLQGGTVAGYTASPPGCAVMQPGSYAP